MTYEITLTVTSRFSNLRCSLGRDFRLVLRTNKISCNKLLHTICTMTSANSTYNPCIFRPTTFRFRVSCFTTRKSIINDKDCFKNRAFERNAITCNLIKSKMKKYVFTCSLFFLGFSHGARGGQKARGGARI